MNKNKSRKLRIGDLVRMKGYDDSLGLVTEECTIEQDIMHPMEGIDNVPAARVKWTRNRPNANKGQEDRIYYEKVLELVERG